MKKTMMSIAMLTVLSACGGGGDSIALSTLNLTDSTTNLTDAVKKTLQNL